MTRFADWPARLDRFLRERRTAEFRYGAHDCCLFAADAIIAMTGVDCAAEFRGHYQSRFGALRRMREACAEATVDAIAGRVFAAHGMPAISPLHACRGDVLTLAHAGDIMLGLIAFDGMPIIAAERGWRISDRAYALKAWAV